MCLNILFQQSRDNYLPAPLLLLQEFKNRLHPNSVAKNSSSQNGKRADIKCAILLASIFLALTLIWFSFDHHFPAQDEAGHIMNSMIFRDLLIHFHPWRYHWWYQCLTVNSFYPPFIYFVNACFLLTFGQSRLVEQLAVAFFTALMTVAVYATVRLLNGNRLTACIAAIFINLYPVISTLSHTFLLDLQAVSMTAVGLMTLLWWRTQAKPTLLRTGITAIVLGCACLSKQLVAAYLLPVGFYFLLTNLGLFGGKLRSNWVIHTLLIGIITTLIILPFILLNHASLTGMNKSFIDAIASTHAHASYLQKLVTSAQLLPQQMSSSLLTIFFISLFFTLKQTHVKLAPLAISALGGFALTCLSPWPGIVSDQRYTAPCLIAAAIYSAFFLGSLISSGQKWKQVTAVTAVIIAILSYFFFNFVPYPVSLSTLPWQDSLQGHNGNPIVSADWGHTLVLDTIEKIDDHKPAYLNILTNSTILNPHTFELLLKEAGNKNITPTSSRSWTVIGDKVDFSPTSALYYQWYLFKSGNTGYSFYNKQSQLNYQQLVNFVLHSGKYNLIAQKTLPDGTHLMLYRRLY